MSTFASMTSMPRGRTRRASATGSDTLARGLGWFSIGLGLWEMFAPRSLTRTLGLRGSERLLEAYGVREIAAGIGILTSRNPAPWVWARVAGDALDLATLAAGLNDNRKRGNVGLAIAAVGGVTALDVLCARALGSDGAAAPQRPRRTYDYSNRSGFPERPETMRGKARDFEIPRDMRTPEALRPLTRTEASAATLAPAP